MLLIVWLLALVAIAILGAMLRQTLRRGPKSVLPGASENDPLQPYTDNLLFQYEPESVRVSRDARVIVHIPGMAWDAEWRGDLIRLEVVEQPPDSFVFAGVGAVEVLSAYDLAAFRMTDVGADIRVERFPEPVDVLLTTERGDGSLGIVTQVDRTWVLAPAARVSPREFEGVDLPPGRRWAAAAVARLGRVCLVRLSE